jgi:hypothetical protein
MLLAASAGRDDHDDDGILEGVFELLRATEPGLDAFADPPVFGINARASQRAVAAAVEGIVRDMKAGAAGPQRRGREDCLGDYLEVWDLREGWVGDGYATDREVTFAAIATRLGLPLATVANRYASAFLRIAGHPYTFENWCRLFLAVKLTSADAARALRRRKNREARSKDDRPATVDQPPEQMPGDALDLADGAAVVDALGPGVNPLLADLTDLIARGSDDERIIAELQLEHPADARRLLTYLRGRNSESPSTAEG